MLRAFFLAFEQLFSRPILGILVKCVLLCFGGLAAVWYGAEWGLSEWLGDDEESSGFWATLGGFASFLLGLLFLPVIVGVLVTLFLETIAMAVEKQHYPHLPPAKGHTLLQGIWVSVRFFVVLAAANALLLLLLLIPPIYAVAWFLVNGWLLGREYFELVAIRRVSTKTADAMRRQHQLGVLIVGVICTGLLLLPGINLALPIIATAVMVHRFHDWRTLDQ